MRNFYLLVPLFALLFSSNAQAIKCPVWIQIIQPNLNYQYFDPNGSKVVEIAGVDSLLIRWLWGSQCTISWANIEILQENSINIDTTIFSITGINGLHLKIAAIPGVYEIKYDLQFEGIRSQFMFIATTSVGIEGVGLQELKVYPMPSAGYFNIEYNQNIIETVSIYTLNGIKVYDRKVNLEFLVVDGTNLATDIYLLEVNFGKTIIRRRIQIIQSE